MKGPAAGRHRKLLLWNIMALHALLGAVWPAAVGAADARAEQSVKAAFALRFAGYVEWPEDANQGQEFSIAVLGADDVAKQMKELAAGRTAKNRPVQVRRISSIRDVGEAQILYVGADHRGELRNLLEPLAGRSILAVTEEESGLAEGSIINLLVADQRVRFEVSVAAARLARLRISSELLSLAVRVKK